NFFPNAGRFTSEADGVFEFDGLFQLRRRLRLICLEAFFNYRRHYAGRGRGSLPAKADAHPPARLPFVRVPALASHSSERFSWNLRPSPVPTGTPLGAPRPDMRGGGMGRDKIAGEFLLAGYKAFFADSGIV
ncbi:MAG: hypothetical protein BJ554DRAFT_1992, partial [Olpidium bornovanus]